MFSDKYETYDVGHGHVERKRFGYGLGFTLNVTDIETDIGFDYGVMAASAALKFANISFEVNIYGVEDAELIALMPSESGSCTKDVYDQLTTFPILN